jgi:outer membrane protein OmpA-like peptidoglycan-associated protein
MYFTRVAYPEFEKNLIWDNKNLANTLTDIQYDIFLQKVYSEIAGYSVVQPAKSTYNQDVWFAKSLDGENFDRIVHPGPPLNNALPNSVCALTENPNILVVINEFVPSGGMKEGFSLIQKEEDFRWTTPKAIIIDDFYSYGGGVNLSMSSDGEVMIVSLERSDSKGKNDLYVCFKKEDGTWSAPKNLGRDVNTSAREVTPALSEDKNTLYFSSNSWGGDNDIFMSKRLDDTWQNWSTPRRFKEPINSSSDDSQPYFNAATGYLYFTSRRDGSSDIYRVRILDPQPQQIAIKGRLIDGETNKLMTGTIYYGPTKERYYKKQQKPQAREFNLSFPKGESFKLKGIKEGYISDVETFSFDKNLYYHKEQDLTINMVPLKVGAKLNFKTIYFQQSKAIILPTSFPTLENLGEILKEYKKIKVEISGHTDNQGDQQALQLLSEQRAVAVKAFLVEEGIDKNRVTTVGYGGSHPISKNTTDEMRKKNRRVEIRITEVE